ncbi:MAG: phospho-N-acetylmuramoyl-pentapeptide-transferase [Candidatus Melainabacteria bacterium]|nr:MAG: phospho-N-acetylmuramoyl-pentapeptide-transferase [Candidatus Melainabacteria bacterium]
MSIDLFTNQEAQTTLLYALLLPFAIALALYPAYIAWLKANEIRQFVREEGPKSHAVKARTPTTGGVVFIASIVISCLALAAHDRACDWQRLQVLILALLCGLIGFFDDLAKIINKANTGLPALARLVVELLLGAAFALLILTVAPLKQDIVLHLPGGAHWPMPPWLFVCLGSFLVAATTNSLNLHDGMDGLAGGTSLLVLVAMAAILAGVKQPALAQLALMAVGALAAFLLFNRYPAKIFMGDTGSLFLGGLIAALTLASGTLFWFIPLAIIYIAESLSVIVQVAYFKLSKPYVPEKPMSRPGLIWLKLTKRLPGEGKRLLRMAPLHHHFEAVLAERGVPEWQVVAAFWLVQLAVCLSVVALFFLS